MIVVKGRRLPRRHVDQGAVAQDQFDPLPAARGRQRHLVEAGCRGGGEMFANGVRLNGLTITADFRRMLRKRAVPRAIDAL
ncbi:MAG: hypothetical protein KJ000_33345 [Pirellulaceae bacterium]|nr:hypothetical protein [Pirellulaceae bacterium]